MNLPNGQSAVFYSALLSLLALGIIMALIFGTLGVWRWRLLKRIDQTVYLECGYDISQSKAKCPECGSELPA